MTCLVTPFGMRFAAWLAFTSVAVTGLIAIPGDIANAAEPIVAIPL